MLRSAHSISNLVRIQSLECHTPMPTPASPLSQIRMTAGSPPPQNDRDFLFFFFACVWSSHASPRCASWVSCYHTGNAFHVFVGLSWHWRECCLDREAKCNNSLSSCLSSWCRAMYMLWKSLVSVHVVVPSLVTHYFCLLVPPETEDLHLSVRGNTGLCSCLIAVLFAPLVIFCACYIL